MVLIAGFAGAQAQAQVYDLTIDIDDQFDVVVVDPNGVEPDETVTIDSDIVPAGGVARIKFIVPNNGPGASVPTTITINALGDTDGPLTLIGQDGTITSCAQDGAGVVTCQIPAIGEPVDTGDGSGDTVSQTAEVILDFQTTTEEAVVISADIPLGANEPQGNDNNSISENITVTTGVDMLVLWDVPATVSAGSTFDWTANVQNIGPNTASSYRLTVPVPAGVINIVPPAGCSLVTSGTQENYVCNITTPMDPNQPPLPFTFSGQISVGDGSEISTSATVDNSDPRDPLPANDTDVFTLSVEAGSDAFVTKTRTPAPFTEDDDNNDVIFVDDVVTFTIGAGFIGDTPTSVTITDSVPSNYEITSVDPGDYDCGVSPFFAGQSISCQAFGAGDGDANGDGVYGYGDIVIQAVVINATAAGGTTVQNTANLTSDGIVDTNSDNDTASDGPVVIQSPFVDLAVNKSLPFRQPDAVLDTPGYQFTLSAENLGNIDFIGIVTITDSIPSGVTVDSAGGNGWVCLTPDPANASNPPIVPTFPVTGPVDLICSQEYTLGSPLEAGGETRNLPIRVTSNVVGTNTNSARVNGPDADPDGNLAGNDITFIDFVTIDATQTADLSITKVAGVPAVIPGTTDIAYDDVTGLATLTANTTATAGEPYMFEIEVQNAGPSDSTNTFVLDTVENLQNGNDDFVAILLGQGATSSNGNTCAQDQRSSPQARLRCVLDNVPANCVTGDSCPLIQLIVIPGRDEGRGGDDGNTRSNEVDAFSRDVVNVTPGTVRATVTFPFVPRSDVTVTKSAPAEVGTGVNLNYTVTARNLPNGLSRADGVVITDTLPLGVDFVSANPVGSGSSCTGPASNPTTAGDRTVTCQLGNLGLGVQRAVNIVVRPNYDLFDQTPDAVTTITNDVRVDLIDGSDNIVTDPFDINENNNEATVVTQLNAPTIDLNVNKATPEATYAVGDPVVYTVTVSNLGPTIGRDIVVTDEWPSTAFVTFQSVTSDDATCPTGLPAGTNPGDIVCTIPVLGPDDDPIDITFNSIATASGSIRNNVFITSREIDDGFDRLAANNNNEVLTTIKSRTDIILEEKIAIRNGVAADPLLVNLRDEFDYRATISISPDFGESKDSTFTDTLPDGMELAGTPTAVLNGAGSPIADACEGADGDTGSFTCELGTLFPNDEVIITIPVRVTAVTEQNQTFTNDAEVGTSSIERLGALNNNENAGSVTVVSSTIAGNVFRDFLDDVTKQGTDTDVGAVPMTLTGIVDGVAIEPITVLTDLATGNFLFTNLAEGVYTVSRGLPEDEDHLSDGTVTAGNIDGVGTGTVSGNTVTGIMLGDDEDNVDNIFRLIPLARIGLAKAGALITQNIDGSFTADYDLVVENLSLEAMSSVSVADTLNDGANNFGTLGAIATLAEGQYAVTTAPSGTCGNAPAGGALNVTYNGADQSTIVDGISLLSGASCTVSFGVTVFPTDATASGPFNNQANTSGTGDLSGQNVTDISDNGATPDTDDDGIADETGENDVTPVSPSTSAGIALVKVGDLSALDTPYEEDDLITYRFTVRNTGDLTLTNVQIRDPLIQGEETPTDPLLTIPTLEPGAANEVTVTATYPMTLANLNDGEVVNTAVVIGTDPFGRTPEDDSGTDFDNDIDTTTTLAQRALLDLVKTAVISGDQDPSQPGDVITYTFTITNLGNVTITNVLLTDPLEGIVFDAANVNPILSIDPGAANAVTMTATYTIDQDDINAGGVDNRASITGQDPDDNDVTDSSGPTTGTDEDTVVPLVRELGLTTTKTQTFVDDGDGRDGLNDVIDYVITVQNTGNVPLTGVEIEDVFTGSDGSSLNLTAGPSAPVNSGVDPASPLGTLAPGETATYLASYTVELDALIAGGVRNEVTGSGEFTDGTLPAGTPTEVEDSPDNSDDNVVEYLFEPSISTTGLTMTKTSPLLNVSRGDVIPYTITLTNENSFIEGLFEVTDRLPNGMIYIPGSATINGVAADVTFVAGSVTWSDVEVLPFDTTVLTLEARILNGARGGNLVNNVSLLNPDTGVAVLPNETAIVRIEVDPLFECTDVVGRVFNDANGNGYQDEASTVGRGVVSDQTYDGGKGKVADTRVEQDESGLPDVRLMMTDGTIITTDENGLFSLPCAAVPETGGSNLIVKVDERSLPAGYRMTTENPRVSRASPGGMTEMNFGATAALPVVRVDLTYASFVQTSDGVAMSPALQDGLSRVLAASAGSPSTMVLTMHVAPSSDEDDIANARRLLAMVEAAVSQEWRDVGRVRLRIEQRILRAGQ